MNLRDPGVGQYLQAHADEAIREMGAFACVVILTDREGNVVTGISVPTEAYAREMCLVVARTIGTPGAEVMHEGEIKPSGSS